MIHSRRNKNVDLLIKVQPSRFRNILRGIRELNGLEADIFVERAVKEYNFFTFTSYDINDNNDNQYTVIKDFSIPDKKGNCSICDCLMKRYINAKTGICFYKEDTNNNYHTTKI